MNKYCRVPAVFLMALFTLTACAKMQPQVPAASASGGNKTIDMRAASYTFVPNNIEAEQGDTILFNITNVSESAHNFTIKDPHGQTIQSVDLPSNKTVPVKITFTETGKYEFYCDKPFHSTLGMKGQIEVVAGSSKEKSEEIQQ